MRATFTRDGIVIGHATSENPYSVPDEYRDVELHEVDLPIAVVMNGGNRMAARKYTPVDGEQFLIALAATYKWGLDCVTLTHMGSHKKRAGKISKRRI